MPLRIVLCCETMAKFVATEVFSCSDVGEIFNYHGDKPITWVSHPDIHESIAYCPGCGKPIEYTKE
jgi:hypothetical protein